VISVQRVQVQSIEKSVRWLDSGFLVLARTKAAVDERGRRRLSEVMTKRRQHHCHLPWIIQAIDQFTRAIDNQAGMNKDIAFGMPFRILRNLDEGLQFGKQLIDRAELSQPIETDRRTPRPQQEFLHLSPNSFL